MENWCILTGDNDGHQYIIPENRATDWWVWVDTREDDELPPWAHRVDGPFHFLMWEET